MANNVQTLMNELILPAAAKRLRGQLTMPQLIHNDVEDVAYQIGDEIKIAAPVYFAEGADFKTEDGATVSSTINASKVTIALKNQPYKQWEMSDREFAAHASSNTLPSAMEAAVDAIAEAVNAACFDLYKKVPNYSGAALGTGADKTKLDLIALRSELQKNKVRKGRTVVLSDDTEGFLLSEFSNLAESGDKDAVVEGLIGRKYGFDVFGDIQAPIHVPGASATGADTVVTNGVSAAGTSVLNLGGFNGDIADLRAGDIIELADGRRFTVATDIVNQDLTANGGVAAVAINEVLAEDVTPGFTATFPIVGTHGVDLGFHKTFAAIAFRKLKSAGDAPGVSIAEMSDPVTGIPLRLMSWYDPSTEKTYWKLSTLFGVEIVDASRAVRMGETA